MNILFHMIILAFIFYFVLKHDLKIHHKKALTRCVFLAVVAGLVQFFFRDSRIEGYGCNYKRCRKHRSKKTCVKRRKRCRAAKKATAAATTSTASTGTGSSNYVKLSDIK